MNVHKINGSTKIVTYHAALNKNIEDSSYDIQIKSSHSYSLLQGIIIKVFYAWNRIELSNSQMYILTLWVGTLKIYRVQSQHITNNGFIRVVKEFDPLNKWNGRINIVYPQVSRQNLITDKWWWKFRIISYRYHNNKKKFFLFVYGLKSSTSFSG